MNPIKQKSKRKVYVTVLHFILYSIWVHVESPKYKTSSPKSSDLAILTNSGQKSLTMFISSCFNNFQVNFKSSEINLKKSSIGIRTRNLCGLRLPNTCALGYAKKTAENVFKP